MAAAAKPRKRSRSQAPDSTWGRDSFTAFARRIVRAYIKRAQEGDLDALEGLIILEREVQEAIKLAGAACHDGGFSWAEIARVTGTSRQAAAERFTPRKDAR
jgi:hypothetical protein